MILCLKQIRNTVNNPSSLERGSLSICASMLDDIIKEMYDK